MNKYEITLSDGNLICTEYRPNKTTNIIEGIDLIKFIERIDETKFKRKERNKNLIYINKRQNKNIRFINYPELERPLVELYKESMPIIRKERDKKRKVVRGLAAAAVLMGGLAISQLISTSGSKADIQTTAVYEQDDEKKIKLSEMIEIEETITPLAASIDEELVVEELNPQDINSLITTNIINTDISASYDAKLNEMVDKYKDVIDERARRWGIAPELMYDIVSQETGGRETNLTQIVFSSWEDQLLFVYNFETNEMQKVVMSNSPTKYGGGITVITENDLKNPKTNISAAAIILQYTAREFNYNIPITIQAYNNGIGAMNSILEETTYKTNISRENLLNDKTGLSWLPYTYVIKAGDQNYLTNVIRHVDQEQLVSLMNDPYTISHIEDGELVEEEVQFRLK